MTKVAQRLLVFFIGLPIIIGIVSLHYYNHIALNIIVVVVSALSANEFYNMASKRFELFPKTTTIIFTAALPFIAYNFVLTDVDLSYLTWILVFAIFAFMCAESLCRKSFEKSLEKIAVTILIIFYCGFMLTFISRMCSIKEDSTIFIYLFFILVFMCDSGAWFFGILFGKSTRGFFKASPNKSLVGFVGGILTSMACALLFKFLFPVVFYGPFWKILIVGSTTAVGAIIGDLIESVFKRSCDVKDSGNLIPGRGGLLDCIDSIILGAPIYYIGIHILYLTAKS